MRYLRACAPYAAFTCGIAMAGASCATVLRSGAVRTYTPEQRLAILRRAQVWTATDVAHMDLRAGPQGPGAFAPNQIVECEYVHDAGTGHSPKFTCALDGDDKVKVKYGRDNGEVYA